MANYLLIASAIITLLAAIIAAFFLTDADNGMKQWAAERFFKAKAKAEKKALQQAGSEKMQGFLKDQLKKNPVVSNEELNDIQGGLGDEAEAEFSGKGGLGAMLGRD